MLQQNINYVYYYYATIRIFIYRLKILRTGSNGGKCANKTSAIRPGVALGPPLPSQPCNRCSKSFTSKP